MPVVGRGTPMSINETKFAQWLMDFGRSSSRQFKYTSRKVKTESFQKH